MTVSPASTTTCPLCVEDGGLVLLRHARLRIIRATSPDVADTPAFYRVVWNAHVAEWSDLAEADQALCTRAVTAVERVLRQQLQPTELEVLDESWQHAGHAGANGTGFGTHFRVRISSPLFEGQSRVARHRLVYDALQKFIDDDGVHVLAIETR